MQKEIKVRVEFTDGYEKRFTEACLQQLRLREKRSESLEKQIEEKSA